jgi:fumarylacetoacetate (FAA) hydrolase
MAFEEHVRNARARRGLEVPPEWYEAPTFYFTNHRSLVPSGEPVRRPAYTTRLDFELELACVIGTAGRDIPASRAEAHIAGYTIFNDWSARDVQRREMAVGLGPSKAKDFASTLGPHLATLEELEPWRIAPGRYDLAMSVSINGTPISTGNSSEMRWDFCELIEFASREVELFPGDVIGSGTVGGGCLLELGPEVHGWLEPGDEVELAIDGIGVISNRII